MPRLVPKRGREAGRGIGGGGRGIGGANW